MMNNNKILTVSYGTFSCTLEGFDDSFDTMKAIAEYFRDLAADDRYFGAEPPQPDAELLARIAEREVSRRVEAREQDGRIMLKAHEEAGESTAAEVATPQDQAPSPVAEAPDAAPVTAATTAAVAAAHAPAFVPEAVTEAPAIMETPASEPVAQMPDAVYAEPAAYAPETAGQTAWEAPLEEDVATEEPVAEEPIAAPAAPVAEVPVETFAAEIPDTAIAEVAPAPVSDAAAFFADSPAVDETFFEADANAPADHDSLTVAFDGPEPQQADIPEAEDTGAARVESIADRLARIRAVVSRHDDADAQVDVDYEEEVLENAGPTSEFSGIPMPDFSDADEELEGVAEQNDEEMLADVARDINEAFEADDVTASAGAVEEDLRDEEVDQDDLAAILQRIETGVPADDTEQEMGGADAAGDVKPLILTSEDSTESNETGTDHQDDDDTIVIADEAISDADPDGPAHAQDRNLFASDTDAGEYGDISEEAAVSEVVEGADAPVTEAETAHTEKEFVESADTETVSPVTARVMKVSTEELDAALESGELETLEADGAEQRARDSEADKPAARDTLPAIGEGSDEDVSRLMAEADHQMEEPEGATRRSAFAHLRAAVAARFADKTMATTEEDVRASADVYRSDLAEVVKPRRPVAEGPVRTDRPEASQAAPLKLVAEQRISEDEVPAAPVAPRRVAAAFAEDTDATQDTGFAAFAEEMGATKLPDLLEAAAAYMAFVEGQEQFSRPQLMTRVRQAEGGNFSREDGLRSFGQLLRAGKIEKMQGGRFAASEDIGYRPDERAAG
ncbi:hypothetical protein [uncultured Roseobacter sp.]|uniref:hypothetical protein n=1 Tax=uncultured Roseobacter sp. TaxID=114847 RepID=UPI0026027CBF|nr:hypothetical protein [uncultured Roseobacter sp.]